MHGLVNVTDLIIAIRSNEITTVWAWSDDIKAAISSIPRTGGSPQLEVWANTFVAIIQPSKTRTSLARWNDECPTRIGTLGRHVRVIQQG